MISKTENTPSGVVEYIVKNEDDTVLVVHTINAVVIENDRGGVSIPVRLVNEVVDAIARATTQEQRSR